MSAQQVKAGDTPEQEEAVQLRREIVKLRRDLENTLSEMTGDTSSYDKEMLSGVLEALRSLNEDATAQLAWVTEGIA